MITLSVHFILLLAAPDTVYPSYSLFKPMRPSPSLFEPPPKGGLWPRYRHVFFDCDSTLSAIEGIDMLARYPETQNKVSALTNAAMNGDAPLAEVYSKRLELISPSSSSVRELVKDYKANLVPHAELVISTLLSHGVQVYIVSGGLLDPIKEFGISLGIKAGNIQAVGINFNQLDGDWWTNNNGDTPGKLSQCYFSHQHSELTTSQGKATIISNQLSGESGSSMLVGDGISDLLAQHAVDLFVGFGGVESRVRVRSEAPAFIEGRSLLPVLPLALGARVVAGLSQACRKMIFDNLTSKPLVFNRAVLAESFTRSFNL